MKMWEGGRKLNSIKIFLMEDGEICTQDNPLFKKKKKKQFQFKFNLGKKKKTYLLLNNRI